MRVKFLCQIRLIAPIIPTLSITGVAGLTIDACASVIHIRTVLVELGKVLVALNHYMHNSVNVLFRI